ncbi:HAD domain-containing protein [Polaromonas sp.]|uniref:HAD domain-containing protein n=1 Tax=Polaromonas sp. TaxID=1869339 RepID=UPI003264455E
MILFLDFDGVLHPDPCTQEFHFCRLKLVEDVLRGFLEVSLVLSSTWRLRQSADTTGDHLKGYFSPDIAARIVGVTPNHQSLDPQQAPSGIELYPREWECIAWLRANRPHSSQWLAIDDKSYLFRPFSKNLIVTRPDTGLTETEASQLRFHLLLHGEKQCSPLASVAERKGNFQSASKAISIDQMNDAIATRGTPADSK